MKKNLKFKIWQEKTGVITVITLFLCGLSIYAVLQIPVAVNLLELPQSSEMKPFGPITVGRPYKQCLPSDLTDSRVFRNNISGARLELYMATYHQQIDADYSVILDNQLLPDDLIDEPMRDKVACGEKCTRNYLDLGVLKGSSVQDNSYSDAVVLDGDLSGEEKICLHIRPLYKDSTYPLTIWLDSQSRPVLRVKKQIPLYQAADYLSIGSPFHLGKELMFGLCLAYLLGLMGFVAIICRSVYEQNRQKQESQAKSEHHKGAGHK